VPAIRLPQRPVFEVLRLAYDRGLSQRAVAQALVLAQRTVSDYLLRFRSTGLAWPLPPGMNQCLFDVRMPADLRPLVGVRPAPDWTVIHADLKRKGVTLERP